MSHTYFQLLYHVVWSTKERASLIQKDFRDRLYQYMAGTFRAIKCYPIVLGGMTDHVHILVSIPPASSIAETIRTVKVSSTKWIQDQQFIKDSKFSWQEGYGAFSVSPSNKESVIRYIQNQEQHHQALTFKDEFIRLLRKHEIDFDEKYLWL